MKKIIFAILMMSIAFAANSQKLYMNDTIIVENDKPIAAIHIVMEPYPNWVKSSFKEWMDDKKDVDLKGYGFFRKKDKLTADKVVIESISPMEMDFKTKVLKKGSGSEMFVYGSFGYDVAIGPGDYIMEYRNMKEMTLEFLNDLIPNYYQKNIEDMETVVNDLDREREKIKKAIVENKEEIVELKEENVELKEEQVETSEKITETAAILEDEKAKLEAVNKKLNKLKKEDKKLEDF